MTEIQRLLDRRRPEKLQIGARISPLAYKWLTEAVETYPDVFKEDIVDEALRQYLRRLLGKQEEEA